MNRTYREQFSKADAAEKYERIYSDHSYSAVLWEVEQELLEGLVEELRESHERIDYLDFATGSGRVLSFMEPLVGTATGIEISAAMAEIAREKLASGEVLVKDITSGDDRIEGQYDLITTFRFILNAEPALRLAALRRLVLRLRDDRSLIVFNNHSQLFSHKALLWPFHQMRRVGRGYLSSGNYMSDRDVRRLANDAGLEIVRSVGYGVLSEKALRLLSYQRLVALEKGFVRGFLLSRIGCSRLYVARRA